MELARIRGVQPLATQRSEIVKKAQPDRRRPDPPPKTRRADDDQELDDALDEALKETFPASDPIAVHEKKRRR